MSWIGNKSEKLYYNPTTNRIPLSVLGNAQEFALAEAMTNFLPGFHKDTMTSDAATPWLVIKAKEHSIPIVPTTMVTLSPGSKAKLARAVAKRKREQSRSA